MGDIISTAGWLQQCETRLIIHGMRCTVDYGRDQVQGSCWNIIRDMGMAQRTLARPPDSRHVPRNCNDCVRRARDGASSSRKCGGSGAGT